jgi:hypothetical protein
MIVVLIQLVHCLKMLEQIDAEGRGDARGA